MWFQERVDKEKQCYTLDEMLELIDRFVSICYYYAYVCVCVCMHACVHNSVCVCACMLVCIIVCVCVCACMTEYIMSVYMSV